MILKYKNQIINTEDNRIPGFEAELLKKYDFEKDFKEPEYYLTIIRRGTKTIGYDYSQYIKIGKIDLPEAERLIEDIEKSYKNKNEFYDIETKIKEIKKENINGQTKTNL